MRTDPPGTSVRPSLAPAIVSGGFAVLVAVVTGAFNWLSRPVAEPGPTLAVSVPPAEAPVRTAAADVSPAAPTAGSSMAEAYPLNFAAFQAMVRNPDSDPAARRQAVAQCVGRTVVWRGFVDKVNAMPPGADAAWTVVLCEDTRALMQSAFKTPAICRFDADEEGRVATLQPGDRITICGECAEHSALGTILQHCRLTETVVR